jgi:hypothetical protein
MSDDKSKTSQQDRIRVDANDPSEVEYLHQQFPLYSHQQILDIIKKKGPLRADILEYLGKMKRSL